MRGKVELRIKKKFCDVRFYTFVYGKLETRSEPSRVKADECCLKKKLASGKENMAKSNLPGVLSRRLWLFLLDTFVLYSWKTMKCPILLKFCGKPHFSNNTTNFPIKARNGTERFFPYEPETVSFSLMNSRKYLTINIPDCR